MNCRLNNYTGKGHHLPISHTRKGKEIRQSYKEKKRKNSVVYKKEGNGLEVSECRENELFT